MWFLVLEARVLRSASPLGFLRPRREEDNMSNTEQATHYFKRAGAVVVLQSTAELARIRVLTTGDEFWVKLTDVVELAGGVMPESKPVKKASRISRVNASPTVARRAVPQNADPLEPLATNEASPNYDYKGFAVSPSARRINYAPNDAWSPLYRINGNDQSQAWTPRDRTVVFETQEAAVQEAKKRAEWVIDNRLLC